MKLFGDLRFWVAAGAIAAYIGLAATYPATWKLPVGAVIWCAGSLWGFFVSPHAIPGWSWLLIALAFAGVLWAFVWAARRARLFDEPIDAVRGYEPPKCARLFGADLSWRYRLTSSRSTIIDLAIRCPSCKEDLIPGRLEPWQCIGCQRYFDDLPQTRELVEHRLIGWLRRHQEEHRLSQANTD